jgi:hypothetical protein
MGKSKKWYLLFLIKIFIFKGFNERIEATDDQNRIRTASDWIDRLLGY